MSVQYLRNLSLVVATASGAGIELGALRVVFEVHRGDLQTPNSCDVRVYNLSDATANSIRKPEFTQLQLKVGYGTDPLQLIFSGTIKQVRKGREDQKDSYVAITAADGDEAYNFSAMAITLAAGATQTQGVKSIIQSMARKGAGVAQGQDVSAGYLPSNLSKSALPRGRTYYGACRDEMREAAAASGCAWSVQDGMVNLVPLNSYIPSVPVLISPATGLISIPEQTQNGLNVTTLLNPAVKIGQLIKLDSKDINQLRYGLDVNSSAARQGLAISTTKLNADGLYYVMVADHYGDTRGAPWYSDLLCLAVDASANPNELPPYVTVGVPTPAPQNPVQPYG